MRLLLLAFGLSSVLAMGSSCFAADLEVKPAPRARVSSTCPRVMSCVGDACRWVRTCHIPCPDGFGCSPLYGAYGPWGGYAYWSDLSPRY
jgi:hypothetical protein